MFCPEVSTFSVLPGPWKDSQRAGYHDPPSRPPSAPPVASSGRPVVLDRSTALHQTWEGPAIAGRSWKVPLQKGRMQVSSLFSDVRACYIINTFSSQWLLPRRLLKWPRELPDAHRFWPVSIPGRAYLSPMWPTRCQRLTHAGEFHLRVSSGPEGAQTDRQQVQEDNLPSSPWSQAFPPKN